MVDEVKKKEPKPINDVKVVAYQDFLLRFNQLEVSEKRKAVLGHIYGHYNVIAKVDLKGEIYFIVKA